MEKKKLLNAILVFLVYFIYTSLVSNILNLVGITDDIITIFIADLLFFLGIVILYKNDLKDSFLRFRKDFKGKEKFFLILKWVIVLLIINIVGGMLTELISPDLANTQDSNTSSLFKLASISSLYTIFKTILFAPIAEELVFRKTVRTVISNNTLFIIVSSLIYALMNIVYAEITLSVLLTLIPYFILSCVLSFVYTKYDNIIITMIIKFCYNLIPLSILLISMGG